MNRDTGRGILAASFVVCVVIVGWKQIKANPGKLPAPQAFVYAGIVFGLLGLAEPLLSPELTSLFGAGVALALSIRAANPSSVAANSPVSGGHTGGSTA